VTFQTKRSHIREIALAAAFSDRHNVIRIPKRFSSSQSPFSHGLRSCRTAKTLDVIQLRHAVQAALGTYPAIALQNAFAQMAWITAEAPFLNAPIRTECKAPGGNLQIAPAAQETSIWALRQLVANGTAARYRALCAHQNKIAGECLGRRTGE
jgi:hypothetical protein